MNLGNNKINIRKNTKRPVLHLIADIESGEYYALIDDGTNKREVHRKITEESQENFNRVVEKSRRNKIMTKFNIGKKEVKNVETIAYKTLEDFDRIYNTDYSEKYVKIVTMEIKETKLKRKSSLTYRKFCEELRREKLRKASIVIDYNLPVMGGIIKNKHKMGNIDKLKFIKYALKSKSNGAKVNFKLNDENKNYKEILKSKITKAKNNISAIKDEKIAMEKDKRTTKKKEKVNKKDKKRKTLKGLYRATLLSLGIFAGAVGGIFAGAVGLKKQINSQSNKDRIESMMDINNRNSLDSKIDSENYTEQEDSKIDKKIKDSKVSTKETIISNNKKEAFNNRITVKQTKPSILNNKNEEKSENEGFSKIKVGSKFTINSGKYFETSTGEGTYGSFEKQDKEPRVLSLIKITTKHGNDILIQDNDKSLSQLKSKYPDAQFSYHFTDVNGNAYGWVTRDSFANNLKREKASKIKKETTEKERKTKDKKARKYGEKDEDGYIYVEY